MFVLSLSACGKSQEEKDLEDARDAASNLQNQYEQKKQEYEDLKSDIDNYNSALDRLNNAQ